MQEEIFEGDRALHYDRNIRRWFAAYDTFLDILSPVLRARLARRTEASILVVGSGSGNEIYNLAQLNPSWTLMGIDPSPEMNTLARKKLQLIKNTKIVEGTIEDISGEFDAAICLLVSHFLEVSSKQDLFAGIAKKLKPGAVLIHADIIGDKYTSTEDFKLYCEVQRQKIDPEIVEQGLNHIINDVNYIPEAQLLDLVRSSGFKKTTKIFQWLVYAGWISEK